MAGEQFGGIVAYADFLLTIERRHLGGIQVRRLDERRHLGGIQVRRLPADEAGRMPAQQNAVWKTALMAGAYGEMRSAAAAMREDWKFVRLIL